MTNQFLFNRLNNIFPYTDVLNISKVLDQFNSFLKDYKEYYPNNPRLYLSIKLRGLDEAEYDKTYTLGQKLPIDLNKTSDVDRFIRNIIKAEKVLSEWYKNIEHNKIIFDYIPLNLTNSALQIK